MFNLQKENIEILITDDHLVIQQGLGMIVKEVLNNGVISYANSLRDTIAVITNKPIDLLFLDINIPGGNNFQMIEHIRLIRPKLKILIFSAYAAETYALRYLKLGINGYLEKNTSVEEIKIAIKTVLIRGKYISAKVEDLLLEASRHGAVAESSLLRLTNRELEIARLIVKGEGTNTIGQKLNLQISTISTHKKNIFDKLKISNVSELIAEFRLQQEM